MLDQTITKLEIQAKNKQRVNLFLDNAYAFSLSLMVALPLKKGQVLSPAEVEQLQQADQNQRAYERSLHFLSFRARSGQEIQHYLRDKEFNELTIETTIARLAEENLLDDLAFAQAWLASRSRQRPKGMRALRYELRQKGIADEIIDAAVAEVDELDEAWQAITCKIRQWRTLPQAEFQRKAIGFLQRRGFDYQTAREACDRAWASREDF